MVDPENSGLPRVFADRMTIQSAKTMPGERCFLNGRSIAA